MKRAPRFIVALILFTLLVSLALGAAASTSAQDDFTVTIGQDKVFTEFNYHDSWFGPDPNNPLPWPTGSKASEGNSANVSLSATPGQAGTAEALVGVEFEWDLAGFSWEEVEGLPITVRVDYSYVISANWSSEGSANAGVWPPDPWYDFIGRMTGETGSRGGTATVSHQTTVGELNIPILSRVYCQAHAGELATMPYTSSAALVLNSIAVEFDLVPARIDFDPDVVALRAPLKYVTTYIELPTSQDVSQIDISGVRLNDTVPALSRPTKIGDHDEDGIPDLMVKFDGADVQSILSPGDEVEILISGEVNGSPFEGNDTIRALDAGKPATAGMGGSIPYLGYVLAGLAGCFVIAAGMFFYFTRGRFGVR